MCGICGMMGNNAGGAVQEPVLRRMMGAMRHRGPDDEGLFIDGPVGLGFRRLSILDLSNGRQPMYSEDKSIQVVVNGEIYNYQSLRDGLVQRGHRFHSQSDAEVIPHLYEEYGIDCVQKLRGMFAVAIVDRRSGDLYLVRDHFGIKPLYYAETPNQFVFASEIRSLLSTGLTARVDRRALWHYLTFQYVPDPATMLEGVFKVPPAHYLHWTRGRIQLVRYWDLAFHPERGRTLEDLVEEIRFGLRESVRLHLASDVPRGAYLSSGIDSSALVAMMREIEPVDTFSIGFAGATGNHNELDYARNTAEQLGTRHHEVEITAKRYLDAWPTIVESQEDPVADPSAPALYFLAEEARKHVTVVLSGEGADELFGGYPIYHEPLSLWPFEYLPGTLRKSLHQWATHLPNGLKGKSFIERGTLPLHLRFLGNAQIFSEQEKRLLLDGTSGDTSSSFDLVRPYYAATRHLDPTARMQVIDCHTWLPGNILMKADKMSMAHSLELRVPFLDVEVFNVAAKIPLQYRIARGTTKYALRKAMEGIVPADVLMRPKLGFPIPIRRWLRHEMRDFAFDVVRSSGTEEFSPTFIGQLLADENGRIPNRDRKLWTILVYLLWRRVFVSHPHREALGGPLAWV